MISQELDAKGVSLLSLSISRTPGVSGPAVGRGVILSLTTPRYLIEHTHVFGAHHQTPWGGIYVSLLIPRSTILETLAADIVEELAKEQSDQE